ncbi:AAA family ATPase [Chryseobacterium gambrini]|uniref:AAA family ATPase n=1 Tax=Chryseobacterium gambrini TaxID=373672 RepID=A0ABM8KA78_9FLAO|nr:AAA family ATPase [Chryseobacterium gambrini]
MSFRLIAIRPLANCNPNFLKNLEIGNIYRFYNDYTFYLDNDKKEVGKVTYNPSINENLYNRGDIKINVSAIVGKNGSGKSTLIDLLICAINNISFAYGFQVNFSGLNNEIKLEHIPEINLELYFTDVNGCIKIIVRDNSITVSKGKFGRNFRQLLIGTKEKKSQLFKKFIDDNFFHTQVLNYSLWAYNHHEMGYKKDKPGFWINNLFHKNDAYQIPIVLNPYRQQGGTIAPSREKELAESRLISNILQPHHNAKLITDNLIAEKLKLKLLSVSDFQNQYLYRDDTKQGVKFNDVEINLQILELLFKKHGLKLGSFEDEKWEIVKIYLNCKIAKIATKYKEYTDYFDRNKRKFYDDKIKKLVDNLYKDSTHITLKLRQVFNFLKYSEELNINLSSTNIFTASYSKSITALQVIHPNLSVAELIPPPIFRIEILLSSKSKNKNIPFKSLSSGERQIIYILNTVFYHLYNLNSVKKKKDKIKYTNLNIILEEIELYFHPEYQRVFINRLLNGIENLNLSGVNLNICFVTHSPFILSDIPVQNIMFLEMDESTNEHGEKINSSKQIFNRDRTFGSNIHDLLADSFFMKNGYMGEFATTVIENLIKELKKEKTTNQAMEKDIIDIIGDFVIRERLMDMYENKYQESTYQNFIKEEYKKIFGNDNN